MSVRNIFILLRKEIVQGPKNFLFLFALVVPIGLTLLLTLVFGTYFIGASRLGIVDLGSSQYEALLRDNQGIRLIIFSSAAELEDAAARGAVDMGILLPAGFDQQVQANQQANVTVYVWGESHLRHRLVLGSAIIHGVRQIAGQEVPVEVLQRVVGEGANIPWEKRLLPLMVMMSILLSGVMVPATSLVTEKVKRTISALAVSPASMLDVFLAKGLLGVILSMVAAFLMLFLNQAMGEQPVLLSFVLLLGSIFSASIGVLLGALVKDITTLFATIKGMGIFLYGPGFVYMFPEIPQWIGRLFPTYYLIHPVLEVAMNKASLADIAPDLLSLGALIVFTGAVLVFLAVRVRETQAAA
jgi:ABC-2 type transport system permease protein